MTTRKIVKSRVSSFSPGEGINTWGLCIARDVAGVF